MIREGLEMYFPYLVVRGEECEAIISTICVYSDNKIIPILEPHHTDDEEDLFFYKSLKKTIKHLLQNKKRFILLVNDEKDVISLKGSFKNFNDYCILGFENDNPNLKRLSKSQIAVIHRKQNNLFKDQDNILFHIFMPSVLRFQTYVSQFDSRKTVLIEDGFICHQPNSEFPPYEDFNSELCFTYKSKNILGFGDFTILPEGYEPCSGAQANFITHVIHLTQKHPNLNKLVVYHFLITPSMEPDNRRRSEATVALAYNNRHLFMRTIGIKMLEDKYPSYTSLGMYKRIGIAHHIDLIHSVI
jgi:hypothetical protein